MTAHSKALAAMLDAGSSGALLTLVLAYLREHRGNSVEAGRDLMDLADAHPAFAESLTDAICLYLQREDSSFAKAGFEFDQLMIVLAHLKRDRSAPDLMRWIDRHRQTEHPTLKQETNFANAIWALMRIHPVDSRTFVRWWMERADSHPEGWLSKHFDPDAIPSVAKHPFH